MHGRGTLLSILEKECILTRIKVGDNGRFLAETQNWSSYWKPIYEIDQSDTRINLDELYSTWCNYIRSGFNSALRKEFCFRYFVLLNAIISNFLKTNADHSWVDALQATLGFECFGITYSSNDEVLGAGTCTLRNPCYLLAKLKMPKAPDDPQFLPIVTVAGAKKPELFYHYRQYTLSKDSPASLMFYPAVSEEKRSTSFRLINSLAGGVSYGIDPRVRERAKRLYQKIIRPALEAEQLTDPGSLWLEFADVGAGSGGLTSAICRQIHDAGFNRKFRLWFVDLEAANPARFFRDGKSRRIVLIFSSTGRRICFEWGPVLGLE